MGSFVKTSFRLCGLLLLHASFALGQEAAAEGRTYTIAIVRDGDSDYFDASITRFIEELSPLAIDSYAFRVEDAYNAGYDPAQVSAHLDAALSDPQVDLIYAAGVIATERAASLNPAQRTKPIIGGALQFSDARGKAISPEGTSQIVNYTFITSPRRVSADVSLLATLANQKRVHALVDGLFIPEMNEMPEAKAKMEAALGIQIDIIAGAASAQAILDRLPDSLSALYVTLLPRFDEAERQLLYEGLAERKIIAVTMGGRRDVELGALAGLATDESRAVARRTALNIHQLIQGIDTSSLPVYLPVFDRLAINAKTAEITGWSPDYDTALAAEFIDGDYLSLEGEPINLIRAMNRAATDNADATISRESQASTEYDIDITKTQLRPTLSGVGSYSEQRKWSRINPLTTPDSSHQESLGLQITQLLFNDEVLSAIRAQKKNAAAARYLTQSSELDAIDGAATAYFDYLSASSLYHIERENLSLTENNFQLAKLRIEIGAAEPSESYRWEQSSARNRANLIQRESARANALIEFNRQIGAPREAIWNFEDLQVADDAFYFMDQLLDPLITNARSFRQFGGFIQAFSVENSPELIAFDLQLAAQGILLRQEQRRFIPEIAGSAAYAYVFQGSEFFATDSENEATLGIQFSLPLFENGQRKAEVLKRKADIRVLAAQRERAVQQIEQRALAAYHTMGAAHPNMRLSRLSMDAAEKNYQSIQEKYSQGAASILDLLDAQQSLLSQRQQAAIANYDYLKTVHQLQRSIAWYEHMQTSSEKAAWIQLLRAYLADDTANLQTQGTRADPIPREARDDALKTIQSSQQR